MSQGNIDLGNVQEEQKQIILDDNNQNNNGSTENKINGENITNETNQETIPNQEQESNQIEQNIQAQDQIQSNETVENTPKSNDAQITSDQPEIKEDNTVKKKTGSKPIQFNPLPLNENKEAVTSNDQEDNTKINPKNPENQEIQTTKPMTLDAESLAQNPFFKQLPPEMQDAYLKKLQQVMEAQNVKQVEFLPIIDVIAEYQRGNFLPALHCLKKNLIPKEWVDPSGYSLIHHSVSYNLVEIALILLDIFKIDINLPSRTSQTPLMIACNFGFNEMIKILCDRGCDLDVQDQSKFSALLYSIKQNSFPAFIYLLYKRCNTATADINGCNIVHWAAYKNNTYLLKLLKRLQFDLWSRDNANYNPFERAASSDALDACKFLLNESGDNYPTRWKVEELVNPAIKELLRRKYSKNKFESVIDKIKTFFSKNQKIITIVLYFDIWILNVATYYRCIQMNQFEFIYHIIFGLFCLYSLVYSLWFFFSSGKSSSSTTNKYRRVGSSNEKSEQKTKSQPRIKVDQNIVRGMNFNAIDKLTKEAHEGIMIGDYEEGYTFPTFLHEIAYLFESNNFIELASLDYNDYCPTCLKIKPPRGRHCNDCNQCIEHYHFHSYTLGRCINKTSHVYYLIFLLQFTIFMILTILPPIFMHSEDRTSSFFLFYLETAWWIGIKEGLFFGLWFIIMGIMFLYSFCFTFVELYGVSLGLTHFEIFNRHECKYLFDFISDKNGRIMNVFKNPFDNGFFRNWIQYLSLIFDS